MGELKVRLKELEEAGNRPSPKKVVDKKAWTVSFSSTQMYLISSSQSPRPYSKRIVHNSPLSLRQLDQSLSLQRKDYLLSKQLLAYHRRHPWRKIRGLHLMPLQLIEILVAFVFIS